MQVCPFLRAKIGLVGVRKGCVSAETYPGLGPVRILTPQKQPGKDSTSEPLSHSQFRSCPGLPLLCAAVGRLALLPPLTQVSSLGHGQ